MSGLSRSAPLRQTRVRVLRPGEDRPEGEPRRSKPDRRGRVRLRWRVGPASYVETFEQGEAPARPTRGQAPKPDISEATRRRVVEVAGGRCWRCAKRGGHVHHRQLRSQGGPHIPSNLILVCLTCHDWIHHHPTMALARGWLVSGAVAHADIADHPVWSEMRQELLHITDDYLTHTVDQWAGEVTGGGFQA